MLNNMTVSELIREVANNANATLMERVLASALDNLGDEMAEKEKDIQKLEEALDNLGDEMDEKEKDIQKLEEALSKISRVVVEAFDE